MNAARLYLAELLGTFLFLTIGYAAVANFSVTTPATAGILVVPFAFGLGLLAAIFAFGHVWAAITTPRSRSRWSPTAERRQSRQSATSLPRSSGPSGPPASS